MKRVITRTKNMQARQYLASDEPTLRQIHNAQNFPYTFPDLRNPLFLTKIVLTDDSDNHNQILGAALLRLTAEAYLLLDPQHGSPRQRWQALLKLHHAAQLDAQSRGLEDVHAWLPPRIATNFGRHIERLGWRRDDEWTPYCKRFYA